MKKDMFGQTETQAVSALKLNDCFCAFHLRIIRGIWILTTWLRPNNYSKKAWKKYPNYTALGRQCKIVGGVGNRSETISAAIQS